MILFSQQALKICANIPVKKERNITKCLHPSKKHTNIHSRVGGGSWRRLAEEPASKDGRLWAGRPSRTEQRLADQGTCIWDGRARARGPGWPGRPAAPGGGTSVQGRPGAGRGMEPDRATSGPVGRGQLRKAAGLWLLVRASKGGGAGRLHVATMGDGGVQ
jgi:hypothetical protein